MLTYGTKQKKFNFFYLLSIIYLLFLKYLRSFKIDRSNQLQKNKAEAKKNEFKHIDRPSMTISK